MKTLLVVAGLVLLPQATAQASVVTIGSSAARTCYLAASTLRSDDNAIRVCNSALQTVELSAQDRLATHNNRGVLYLMGKKIDAASRDFDAAMAIDPVQPEAWLNKSVALHNAGLTREAMVLATRALELRTRKPALAYFVRGLGHEAGGNVRAAYADLVRARDLDPRWAEPAEELRRYRVVRN
ncbi:MAG: hypothetical protein M3Q83_00585 [Pseudomonadota bacterium]|nr:hypothetical protein [Pseudomonadota bacterium]